MQALLRTFWLGSCTAMTIALYAATASAQANSWNGIHIGAFAGGAWGNGDIATDVGSVTPTSYFSSDANIALIEGDMSGNDRSGAFTGGVQLGVTQRFDQIVVGAEVDFGAFNLSGGRGATDIQYPTFPGLAYTARASYSTNWLLTARGRIGWLPAPNLLLYFTGGLALSDVKASNSFFDEVFMTDIVAVHGFSSKTRTKAGYTLGGGIEASLWGPWSVRAEYLYVDLGKVSTHGAVTPPLAPLLSPLNSSIDLTANIARVGINYSFGD